MGKKQVVNTCLPYTHGRLVDDVAEIQKRFPQTTVTVIGYSCLGKPLHEVRLGSGAKKVHLNASFHANEWITSLVLMKWVEDFLEAVRTGASIDIGHDVLASQLLEETTISIVPMVNPDGVDLVTIGAPLEWQVYCLALNNGNADYAQWKANIRGVDLNNQFPAKWEIERERKEAQVPAPRDFPGFYPLSEPESRAMAQLVNQAQFDRIIALHTQGQEFYWGYEQYHPALSSYLAKHFAELSGYKAVEHVDSHAGFRDWFIYQFGKPGFTVELGIGENPLPLEQFDEIYHDVQRLIHAAVYL